jgi:predicted O-methyltransferase YrrM
MIHSVRPYEIFNRVTCPSFAREATVKIPQRSDMLLIETLLLVAAMKSVNARRIFEFGTYYGATTLNLALNCTGESRVYTLDLPVDHTITQHPEDARVTREHFALGAMQYMGSRVESKITALTGNSAVFDFSPFRSSMDFIFIDGGHDLGTVKSDTENAFFMLRSGGCIAWHDYRNPNYPELTAYLESLPFTLFAVQESMLVFWFAGLTGRV